MVVSKKSSTFAPSNKNKQQFKSITIMKTYFIIEHKTVITVNGKPYMLKGEKIYRTEFVHTIKERTNVFENAKRFSTKEAAQKYIDRWLSNKEGDFIIKGYDY